MEGRVFKILIFYNKDEKDHHLSELRKSITKHLQERLQGFTYQIEIDSSKDIVEHIISNPVKVMEDIILSLTERVQQSDLILVDITYENIDIGIEIGRYIESSSKSHLFFIHETKAENRVNKQNLPFYLKYKRVYDLNLEEDKKLFLEEIYNYFKSIIYSPYHRFRISLNEVKTILSDIDNINNFKILKAPNAALVLGEYAVTTGKMAIYLPIPSTNYIAIREVNTPSSSISYYFPFLKENLCEKRNLIKWLSLASDISKKQLLKRLDSILDNKKLDIRIFTKLPPLCGLASSSIIASAIALYMYKKEIKQCIDSYKRYLKNKEDKNYLNKINSIMSIILDTRARINDIFIINFMQNRLSSCDIKQDKIKYIINNSRLFDYKDQIVLIELYKTSVDIVQILFLEILNFYSSLLRLLQSFKKRFPKLFENIKFQIRNIKYIKFKNFSSISSNLLNNKIRKIIETEISQLNLFDLDDDLLEDYYSINTYYSLLNLTVGIKDITVKKYIELYNRIKIDVKNLEKSLEIIINIFNNDKYKNLLLISKENKIEYFYITKKITITIDLIIKIISSLNIYILSNNILNSLKEIIVFSFIKEKQFSKNNIEDDRLSISQLIEEINSFKENYRAYEDKIIKFKDVMGKEFREVEDKKLWDIKEREWIDRKLENNIDKLGQLKKSKNIEKIEGLEEKLEILKRKVEEELKNKIEGELDRLRKDIYDIEQLREIEVLWEIKSKIDKLDINKIKSRIEEIKEEIGEIKIKLLNILHRDIQLHIIYKKIYHDLKYNLIVHKYLYDKSVIFFSNKIFINNTLKFNQAASIFENKINIFNSILNNNEDDNQLVNIVRKCNNFNLLSSNNFSSLSNNGKTNKINSNELYNHFCSAKELFIKIFKQAFKIDNKVFHGERGSGAGCFAILAGTSNLNPVIYWSQERKINDKNSSNDKNSETYNWALKEKDIDKIKCYGIRLDDFDPSSSFIDYVGHFGLVFSGSTKVTEQLLEELKEEENFRIINKDQEIQSHPHLGFKENSNYLEELFNLYGKITLQGLEYYFRGKLEFGSIDKEKFLTSIQLSQKLFEYIGIYDVPHFSAPLPPDYYPYYIVQAFNNFSIEIGRPVFAAKVTGGGKGGDILVLSDITDKEEFNIHFFNVLNTIRQKVISQKPELVEKIGKEHFLSSWLNRDKDFDVKGINFVDIK